MRWCDLKAGDVLHEADGAGPTALLVLEDAHSRADRFDDGTRAAYLVSNLYGDASFMCLRNDLEPIDPDTWVVIPGGR